MMDGKVMRSAFPPLLLAASVASVVACAPGIHGRAEQDVEIRVGCYRFEKPIPVTNGVFDSPHGLHEGETATVSFTRPGYYPQIVPVRAPGEDLRMEPSAWRPLPDETKGVLAGWVFAYATGGRHTPVTEYEKIAIEGLEILVDGISHRVTLGPRQTYDLLLPPGRHEIRVPWADFPGRPWTQTVQIQAGQTTLLDIGRLTALID